MSRGGRLQARAERGRLVRRPTPLGVYMTLITALAVPLTAWSIVAAIHHEPAIPAVQVAVLAVLLFAGELVPIQISRRGQLTDEVTVSSVFALALLLIAAPGLAIAGQAAPVLLDDIWRRKHWSRPAFNVAQYVVTFLAARLTFALVS